MRICWKPSRVAFFFWIAALGNIITINNLQKQKILILDWCCMCKRNGESVDHLLIYCPRASDLANLWCLPFLVYRNSAIWMVVPHCLMWCIWRERNNWHFEDLEKKVLDLKLIFFKTLLD